MSALTYSFVNTIRSEVIKQVLHNIHLIRGHIVEGDSAIATAPHPLHHRVVNILPVPKVFGHVTGNKVVLGHKRKKSTAAQRISKKKVKKTFNE